MGDRIISNIQGGQWFRPARRRFGRFSITSVCAVAALLAGLTACAPTDRTKGGPSVGGPFTLTDQNGARETQSMLRGKWSLVFFGYTFCPDVCPITLSALGAAIGKMGPAGRDVRVVFITVDPDRDTPAQLKRYLSSPSFPPGAIGLTGTPAQVAQVARAYHVYFHKSGTGPGYGVDHTSVVFLMTPQGQFDRPVDVSATPDAIAGQIETAKREG